MLEVLQIIIYFLLIIILVVGIILGIKSIKTMNKVEKVVDDVNNKVQTLNGFFNIVDFTTDKIVLLTDRIVDLISIGLTKIFKKKKNEEKED